MAMQLWLSHRNTVASSCCIPMCHRILLSQIASHDAKHVALYSAYVEDSAIVGCFLLIQENTPKPKEKQYLEIDFLESTSLAQSELQCPIKEVSPP